jgi:hypothetical protein
MIDFCKDFMNPIFIKNEEFLDILGRCSDLLHSDLVKNIKIQHNDCHYDDYTSDEYLKEVVDMGRSHAGFPKVSKSFLVSVGRFSTGNYDTDLKLTKVINELNLELLSFLGVRHNALFMIYPPGGFIDWHNNANAPGYNVLLTYSEEGKGEWNHIDRSGEKIVIPDIKGWQCKYGYYGPYDEPENLVYHCAKTDCWRMTVAFVYNSDEEGRMMAELMLEDISSK